MKPPRFTLRDLFWLVLVVGMGCAWGLSFRAERAARLDAEFMRAAVSDLQIRLHEVEEEAKAEKEGEGDTYSGFLHEFKFVPNDPHGK